MLFSKVACPLGFILEEKQFLFATGNTRRPPCFLCLADPGPGLAAPARQLDWCATSTGLAAEAVGRMAVDLQFG